MELKVLEIYINPSNPILLLERSKILAYGVIILSRLWEDLLVILLSFK